MIELTFFKSNIVNFKNYMFKICKIIILLIFVSFPLSVNAHVQHYEDLNRIEFDIYRNNKHIGTHIFSFKKSKRAISCRK